MFARLLAEIMAVLDFIPHVETIEVPQAPLLDKHNHSREVSSRGLASFILCRQHYQNALVSAGPCVLAWTLNV